LCVGGKERCEGRGVARGGGEGRGREKTEVRQEGIEKTSFFEFQVVNV